MKSPSIVINGEVYIAQKPKLKLWRQIAEFRNTAQRQSAELMKEWEKANILRDQADELSMQELNTTLLKINAKVDELKE
jgi:hypothetical protein